MAITYTGDPSQLQTGAKNTAGCLGELENHLRALTNLQDEFGTAVKSEATAPALRQAFIDAYTKGKALGGSLQNIIDALNTSGVQVSQADAEAQSAIVKAGLDGLSQTGGVSTNW
ncbi:hypothetical protein [Nocardia blacklockiae]|uniref:hypothetical protein n=1 Tax=Nocardia blacklockiae TaxID=480036 RepID=UPI00189367BA|nr:hypothetical protein [Nocardia blacklockiae]MBF6175640.1 hypothetical protein [Nocardia blacklockiae]